MKAEKINITQILGLQRELDKLKAEAGRPELMILADKWPSAIVVRDKIEEFSGGLLKKSTMQSIDSQGEGPRKRYKIGKKVCYPVLELILWLEEKLVIIE